MRSFKRIAVYCGSSNLVDPKYLEVARETGRLLAQRDIAVVNGGGRVGLMGATADAALAAGGEVFGVIPTKLMELEQGHTELTELFVVDNMASRKSMMIHLSDGYIALPGGYGTWEELMEVVTLGVLNYHHKPVGLLNLDGFYDPLLEMIRRAEDERFIRAPHRGVIEIASTPEALLEQMAEHRFAPVDEWLGRG